MPEMPEVETIRRQLVDQLVGATILEAGSHPSAKFVPAVEAIDMRIERLGRRGKFLLVEVVPTPDPHSDNDDRPAASELVIHLGMTGKLSLDPDPDLNDPYLRAWWRLDDGRILRFDDVRRFGRIRLVARGDYSSIPTLANAGPEPFDPELTAEVFWQRLKTSRRKLKTQLLSQRPVAGVGNIYADEALWLAEINPKITRLGLVRAERLLDAIRIVLEQGVNNGGTTLRDYRDAEGGIGANQLQLAAYGRSGEPCLRCNSVLRSAVLDARTTVWCPRCQER